MTVNVSVKRTGSESATSTIRRFTKRVQGSGIVRRVKGIRFHKRAPSRYVRKKQALKSLKARARYEELAKLGRLPEPKKRGGR